MIKCVLLSILQELNAHSVQSLQGWASCQRILWEVAKSGAAGFRYQGKMRAAQADGSTSGSHLLRPLHCRQMLPLAPTVLPPASPHSFDTPPYSLNAPSLLPLKRPCSLSRTETVILDPKFGVYIIDIYIYVCVCMYVCTVNTHQVTIQPWNVMLLKCISQFSPRKVAERPTTRRAFAVPTRPHCQAPMIGLPN